jgi:hypothetical protein
MLPYVDDALCFRLQYLQCLCTNYLHIFLPWEVPCAYPIHHVTSHRSDLLNLLTWPNLCNAHFVEVMHTCVTTTSMRLFRHDLSNEAPSAALSCESGSAITNSVCMVSSESQLLLTRFTPLLCSLNMNHCCQLQWI